MSVCIFYREPVSNFTFMDVYDRVSLGLYGSRGDADFIYQDCVSLRPACKVRVVFAMASHILEGLGQIAIISVASRKNCITAFFLRF